jgi:phosphinothricin acetyltransferase
MVRQVTISVWRTATRDGRVAGVAYCAQWKAQPAYRHTVQDSI